MTAALQRAAALQRVLNTPAPKWQVSPPSRASFASVLAKAQLAASTSGVSAGSFPRPGGPVPYQALVEQAARKNGLDPALLAAVAQTESGFNPRAQSRAGAKGVMQLMDATATRLGVTDAFDPAQSLEGGARFLVGLLKHFNGDVRLALAAYNAGPGAVQKYGGIPPYQETQRYVPKVLAQADTFRRIWAGSAHHGATDV